MYIFIKKMQLKHQGFRGEQIYAQLILPKEARVSPLEGVVLAKELVTTVAQSKTV